MPIVAIAEAKEIPWRPGYRSFVLAGQEQGMACASSHAIMQPGAGAPLHIHAGADEILIVLEGELDVRLGEERRLVGPDHAICIPAGTPHAFTATGPGVTRMLTFLPRVGAFADTSFLEGEPPAGAALK